MATVVVTTTTILIPPASLDLDVVVEPQPSRLLAAVATARAQALTGRRARDDR